MYCPRRPVSQLPVGYWFKLGDKELVGHFLRRKIDGHPSLPPLVPEFDVFRTEPWNLPGESDQRAVHRVFQKRPKDSGIILGRTLETFHPRFHREDAASGPTYLYINPLHRRIEDFAFRRRGDRASATAGASLGDGGTASSKQLLYVDPDDADAASSSLSSNHKLDGGGGHKSIASPCPLQNDPATTALALLPPPMLMNELPVQVMEAKECSSEEVIKVVREVGEGGKGQGGGEESVEEVVKEVVVAEKERGSRGDRKEEDGDEDEEEAGGISDREDSILLYPGSPSFREYCVLCFDESGDAQDDSTTKDVDGEIFVFFFSSSFLKIAL
ncbi:hypothetical protein NL676_015198 [Syzygium grande]|nr:hypothetical protein NL676_015198 [Syzygium grande]